MKLQRTDREIVAPSKLSSQTINRYSSGIADNQDREGAAEFILGTSNPLRPVNNSPRPNSRGGVDRLRRIVHRRHHRRRISCRREGHLATVATSPGSPPLSTPTPALSSIVHHVRRRSAGIRITGRRRNRGSSAANPITPTGGGRAGILATPDHSTQPVLKTGNRHTSSSRLRTTAPGSSVAHLAAPEAARLEIACCSAMLR